MLLRAGRHHATQSSPHQVSEGHPDPLLSTTSSLSSSGHCSSEDNPDTCCVVFFRPSRKRWWACDVWGSLQTFWWFTSALIITRAPWFCAALVRPDVRSLDSLVNNHILILWSCWTLFCYSERVRVQGPVNSATLLKSWHFWVTFMWVYVYLCFSFFFFFFCRLLSSTKKNK